VSFRSINSRYEYAVDAQIGGYAKAVSGYMKSISGADFAFTLTLPKADSFASGTVVDRFGRPMCGVDVRPQFVSNVHTTTDSNGHFRLVGVPQGDVYIVLTVSAGKIGHDWAFGGRNDSILHCRTLEDWKASLAAHNAAIATDPNLHGDGEDANVLFDNAEKSAAAKGKDILLVFGSSWCGACYQISHFLEDPNVRSVISAHYVVQEFDVFETTHAEWENPHGIDLYKRFSHGINTIPLWVIVDPSGQDLGDSVKDGKNTGFGGNNGMREYFLSKITSTAPSITDSELKVLQEALYHVSDDELTVPDSQTPGTTSASGAHG
jgi:thiol-disulfide isomerase/thioredoxin